MKTQLIRSTYNLRTKHLGAVITIGNFDGVHLGHRFLIQTVINKAEDLKRPSMVITFEPHPAEFFASPDHIPARLTRFREKYTQLANLGLDYVLVLPFNQKLAALSAEDFLTDILYKNLHVSYIVIGDDFRFGHQRAGDLSFLQKHAYQFNYGVEAISSIVIEDERISSSRIRLALEKGDITLANRLLGRPYTMQGRVRGGDRLGRQWGFPTANIFLHRKVTPLTGIFTVKVHGIETHSLPGVANLGIRPTVNGTRTLLEVHLLDFNQDIYGRYVEVEFCQKLREEIHYSNVDELILQIARDVKATEHYFKNENVL